MCAKINATPKVSKVLDREQKQTRLTSDVLVIDKLVDQAHAGIVEHHNSVVALASHIQDNAVRVGIIKTG